MPASGRPVEVTFTPEDDGLVKVTASFSAEGGGTDWGSGREAKLFVEQSGTTTYKGGMRMSNARAPYTITATFSVAGGSLVKCGLYGNVTGAASVTFYDVKVVADYSA